MNRIARRLPGELENDLDPREFGFRVVKDELPKGDDADARLAQFYARAKERTGVTIPKLESYLETDNDATTEKS